MLLMHLAHASRLLIGPVAALIVSMDCVAQSSPAAPPPQAQPVAATPCEVSPKVVQIGQVAPNSLHPAKFTLTNRGTTPLKVASAIPSCKCTDITNIVGQVIQPGGTLDLSASMKAPPVPGAKDAEVFVTFEGWKAPVIAKISGEVVMSIVPQPPFVDALKGVTSGSITLRSADGKPFRILSAGGAVPNFKGFDAATGQPQAQYEIAWDVSKLAALPLWWVIETDRDDAAVIPLRIRNENTGSKYDMPRFDRQWIAKDSIALAGLLKAGMPGEIIIEIEHYNPPQRKTPKKSGWDDIKSLTSKDPSVKFEIVEKRPIGNDRIELRVKVTASKPGLINSDLTLTTATGTGDIPFIAKVQ